MPVPESELNTYLATVLAKYDHPSSDPELAARIRDALRAGLVRLNAVPAEDPFWLGTNEKPTVFKLDKYYRQLFSARPDDEAARWVLIAIELDFCSGFGCELLEGLVENDLSQLRWLVASAQWVRHLTGCDTRDLLRASLSRLRGRVEGFDRRLEELIAQPDLGLSRAAKFARAVLNPGGITDAV